MREERGLTQEEVATRAGFTAKYLSECERGLRDLPLSSLRSIVEDGLGSALEAALSAGADLARATRDPVQALPRALLVLCREIAELPPAARREVVDLLRRAIALTRRTG